LKVIDMEIEVSERIRLFVDQREGEVRVMTDHFSVIVTAFNVSILPKKLK